MRARLDPASVLAVTLRNCRRDICSMVRLAGFLGTENNYRVDVGIAHSEFLRGENGVGGGRLALRCLTRIPLVTMPLKIEDCARAPEGFLTDHAEGEQFYESIKAAGLADFDFGY